MSEPQLFDQDSSPTEDKPIPDPVLFAGCYLPRERHVASAAVLGDMVKLLFETGYKWLKGEVPDSVIVAVSNYLAIQLNNFARITAQESAICMMSGDMPDDLASFGEANTTEEGPTGE